MKRRRNNVSYLPPYIHHTLGYMRENTVAKYKKNQKKEKISVKERKENEKRDEEKAWREKC